MEEWGYVADDLCCSETMRFELKQCLKYASLCGVDVEEILRSMYENGDLPCPDSEKEGSPQRSNGSRKADYAPVRTEPESPCSPESCHC